ncbi:hypothetical protein AB0B10_25490 [Micromonospora arborensis]|uniref:hypothetical protein n=1 Tax=Micromonospora arborensis TaxID=2116518 RepID=UPI0033D9FBE4
MNDLYADLAAVVAGLTTPLTEEQLAELKTRWDTIARPPLIKQLDALIGPVQAVLGEACEAFNYIRPTETQREAEGFNVCKGATVAVIRRLGSPELPGRIVQHHPGCDKHSRLALASLGAIYQSPSSLFARSFHQIVPLDDARREIRQQELAREFDSETPKRRWWARR